MRKIIKLLAAITVVRAVVLILHHNENHFIKRADEALYQSKHEERSRYTFLGLNY